MENKLDWTKPIQTRDGYKARLIWTGDLGTGFTVEHKRIVAVSSLTCGEFVVVFGEDGKSLSNENKDIINVPEKQYWSKPEHIPNGGHVWLKDKYSNICYPITQIKEADAGVAFSIEVGAFFKVDFDAYLWSENCAGPWKECLVEDSK